MREIAFDTETTGLDHQGDDRIIELGCVELENYLPTGRIFQTYVNPGRSVSQATIEITGITDEKLIGQPYFEAPEIVDKLLEFIGDSQIVAHNASFDRGFLNAELKRCGKPIIAQSRWTDTLAIARQKFPGSPASLDALCRRFNVDLGARSLHGALLDAQLLAEVYLELNGGRVQSLDLAHHQSGTVSRQSQQSAKPRETPLDPRISQDEAAAHSALIERIGKAAIWHKYSD